MRSEKEKFLSMSVAVSLAAAIFGSGIIYQRSQNNYEHIEALILINSRLSDQISENKEEIKKLSNRITSLEVKIDALDEWCRKTFKNLSKSNESK